MAQHIFIEGPLGSGKTLTMSLLAHYWRDKVRGQGGDIKLFSNYGLKESQDMSHYEDWYEVAETQGSICCWDEAQVSFDSRQALKAGSTYATHLMMYTRKMKSVQMYCSPSIQNVDSRLRQIVEVLIRARKAGDGIALDFIDYQGRRYLHTQYIPGWKKRRIFKLGLYDTYNMVNNFPLPQNQRNADKFFKTLQEIHDINRKPNQDHNAVQEVVENAINPEHHPQTV